MKHLIIGIALLCAFKVNSGEEVRLINLDPPEAQQYIDKQDTSLKYAPKVDSNVPAVRFLGNEPHNVLEDIYLANQYHGQDGLGGYLYGYSVPDIAKTEKKKAGGDLRGAYNYIAGNGQEIKVEYWDDGTGFHQIDNVPKVLPQQIEDTPEVKAAKEEHQRLWNEQAERNSKPIPSPYDSHGNYAQGPLSPQGQQQTQHLVTQYQQQKQQFPNPGQNVHYQGDQSYQSHPSQNVNTYQEKRGELGGFGGPSSSGSYRPNSGHLGGSGQFGIAQPAVTGQFRQQSASGQLGGGQYTPAGSSSSTQFSSQSSTGGGQSSGGSHSLAGRVEYGGDRGQFGAGQSSTGGQYGAGKTAGGQFGGSQAVSGQYGQQGGGFHSAGSVGSGQFGAGQSSTGGQYGAGKAFGGSQAVSGQYGQQGGGSYSAGNVGSGQYGAGKASGGQFGSGQYGGSSSGQYSGSYQASGSQTNTQYASGNDEGQWSGKDDEGQWKDDQQEEQGPPKGFFYSFDYPVGIIVQKDGGGSIQKREGNLKDIYAENRAEFERQLRQGSAKSSSGYLVV